MPDITIIIEGELFANSKGKGWKSLEISRSLENLAGAFSVEYVDIEKDTGGLFDILTGQVVEFFYGETLIMTGFIDDIEQMLEASIKTNVFSGRDKTADLIDCSIENVRELKNVRLEDIAAKLAAPFGVRIVDPIDTGAAFDSYKIQPGESPFDAIERATRQRGLLLQTKPDGNLAITTNNEERSGITLREGDNFKEALWKITESDRFSKYIVLAQRANINLDEFKPADRTEIKGVALDDSITRLRPKVIISEGQSTPAGAQTRAEWESTIAEARSVFLIMTVFDWAINNILLTVKKLVSVISPTFGFDTELLISSINYIFSKEKGTISKLKLVQSDAYKTKPVIIEKGEITGASRAELGYK